MKTGALIVPLAALLACGTISNDPPPELPGPPEPSFDIDGEWTWQLDQTEDGVQRTELERWVLTRRGDDVRGRYERQVVVQSVDGTPFRCNQQPRYELRTRYELSGHIEGAELSLLEVSHETVPSPCETGTRQHAAYRGSLADGVLRLEWDGGAQSLVRTGEAHPPEPLPQPDPSVAGAWAWSTRTDTRIEQESWQLDESSDGTIAGSYERIVDQGNCQIVARYQVRGMRRNRRVEIAETEVAVAPAPCERHDGQRTLDSARGTSYGDALVLEWRGGRRQVLSRR